MNRVLLATFMMLSVAQFESASGDMFTPSHSCSKPFKPYEFSSEWELDSFMAQVERYKGCIMDFVEEQQAEAQNHQQAAKDAIDDWNSYVNYELR